MAEPGDDGTHVPARVQSDPVDLIPREFLRVIAVWSLVPSYMLAGAFLGYLADRFLGWFPYLTCAGLLLALILAVRDMLRLHAEL